MVADDSALVLVLRNDNLDSLIAKIQKTGAANVQLLVPDGVTTLQKPASIKQLRGAMERAHIELVLITSDEQTLAAARSGQIETLGIYNTRVAFPDSLSDDNGERGSVDDDQFLHALNAVPPPATRPVATPTAPDDDEIFAALDDLSDTFNRTDNQIGAVEDYDAFAAELDAWSDQPSRNEPARLGGAPASGEAFSASRTPPPPPRPRIRPEDIELTADEKRRAGNVRAYKSYTRPSHQRNRADDHSGRQHAQSRQRPWFVRILPIVLLVLLIVIVLLILFGNPLAADRDSGFLRGLAAIGQRATIVVRLPDPDAQEQPFTQPVPIVGLGTATGETAVQAQQVNANAEYTITLPAMSEIPAPDGTANGIVTIFSQNTQPLALPEGTQFIGTNAEGQEVRFVIDVPITVPPASISDQGAQLIINRGQAQASITAVAPGSASNIPANSIQQILLPGQSPIIVNTGAILLQHGEITGGSERMMRIIREEDVQQVLGQALVGLDNQAYQAFASELTRYPDLELERSTIIPRGNDIVNDETYTLIVDPPPGTEMSLENPNFNVTTRVTFRALATPASQPLERQLQLVVPRQLLSIGGILPGQAPAITNWRWDGVNPSLTVEGVLRPTGEGLDARTRAAILASVKGKSRSEAEAALEHFVQQGVIGGYMIEFDGDTLPRRSFQLTLEVQSAIAEP